jgi:prolyl 4-hydroxylase
MQTLLRTNVGEGIYYFDEFISPEECAEILQELDATFWSPSLTYQKQPDGKYLNVRTLVRVSETAHQQWFSAELNIILRRIECRLVDLFQIDPTHLECWQATDYRKNGKFDYHLDAGYWDDHWAGDRILTFLLYLAAPLKGGRTHFRALDLEVEARAGRLLVWENLFPNGDCNHRMVHSGTPVMKGRKTTLVTWQRQKAFRVSK